jgi:DNA-directed RNA polymerase specialized sigma24 family protein
MTSRSEADSDMGDAQQELLKRVVAGDEDAMTEVVTASMGRLKRRISKRLPHGLRRHTDEDDVAQSVLNSFIGGMRQGDRFRKLNDTNDLWQILGMLTKQKLAKHLRRFQAQKRGAGNVRGDSIFISPDQDSITPGLDGLPDQRVSVADEIIRIEEVDHLLEILEDDKLKKIALLKLQGYEHEEIARDLSISVRSVGRKMNLIRDLWQNRLSALTDES